MNDKINDYNTGKNTILQADKIKTYFSMRRGLLQKVYGYKKAVDDVSFSVSRGETLGIVGESGCGKSTLGRTIMRLIEPAAGNLWYFPQENIKTEKTKEKITENKGEPAEKIDFFQLKNAKALFKYRRKFQMIFQDPNLSLDPGWRAYRIVEEPLIVHDIYTDRKKRRESVYNLLEKVGISSEMAERYPHEFSGGQKQRIGIARALALNPEIIVADEPVSALDVSVQAQVLNLMRELQNELGLTYIFISHNLAVINHISDKIMVLYMGRVMELAENAAFFEKQYHPYSKLLKDSILTFDEKSRDNFLKKFAGNELTHKEVSDLSIAGKDCIESSGNYCYFSPRCGAKTDICLKKRPELKEITPGRFAACHNHL